MSYLKIHTVLMNVFCFICNVFVILVSSMPLFANATQTAWLLYVINIALPLIAIIASISDEHGANLKSDSYNRGVINGCTLLSWGTPIQAASASRVIPLVGELFERSWVLGIVCGLVLAISTLSCFGINILLIGDYIEKHISSKFKKITTVCLISAFALSLLHRICFSQSELNDCPFVALSILLALSLIPVIWHDLIL